MLDKLNIVVDLISKNNLDGILLTSEINRNWFLDFKSSWGYLFINNSGQSIFLVDSRYFFAAKEKINNVDQIVLSGSNLVDQIKSILNQLNIKKLGVESDYCLIRDLQFFSKFKCEIIPLNTQEIRIQKNSIELSKLQKAADIAAETINWIRNQPIIGKTEIEVAKLITIHMLELGASQNSFDPIVASGVNGAIPHHSPSNKIIQENELVTIDIGCVYDGYCSDITRTFSTGKNINQKLIDIYNCVLEAQLNAIQNAKLNMTGSDIDNICREIIKNSNFGQYFTHSTGHGVGMEVHELPHISPNSSTLIKPYYVFTIEPGIYINDLGGVRIEDTVYIDENNNLHILTHKSNKNII